MSKVINSRFPLPDLLKGFAVFLIIPVHILETIINTPGRESLFGKIILFLGGPVAVPVFMSAMGYFIANGRKNAAQTFFRGAKIFILGFLLNIGLNFHLLLKIKSESWPYDPLEYIFGVDIFYLAGLSIILLSVLKTLKKGQVFIAGTLAVLVAVLTSAMNNWLMVPEKNYIFPFIAGNYGWSYFPLFPWLVYPLLGFIFRLTEPTIVGFFEKRKWLTLAGIAIIIVPVIAYGRQGVVITINLCEYYHHTFAYTMWVLGIVILWALLLKQIVRKSENNRLVVFFRWLGKNITLFYIIQWLIIGNVATAIYQSRELKEYPFWFAAIFILTLALTWFVENRKQTGKLVFKNQANS